MIDKDLRQALNDYGQDEEVEYLLFDPSFDHSIIGVSYNGHIVYDRDKMVEELANEYITEREEEKGNKKLTSDEVKEAYEDAESWIDVNTMPSLGYAIMGANQPIVIEDIEKIKEKYN